jgi:hypothetical protein
MVLRNYFVLSEKHSVLHCPQVQRVNTYSLVKMSDLKMENVQLIQLIPDFSKPENSEIYFCNKFLLEQYRRKNLSGETKNK